MMGEEARWCGRSLRVQFTVLRRSHVVVLGNVRHRVPPTLSMWIRHGARLASIAGFRPRRQSLEGPRGSPARCQRCARQPANSSCGRSISLEGPMRAIRTVPRPAALAE